MRRLLFLLLGPPATALAALVLAAGPAAADSPHFISEGTASILSSGAYQVSNFKEAGLGNTVSTESITLSATATATYACVNGGGKHPKATNKASVTEQVSNTGSFPVRNGSTTGTLAVGPPPAPAFSPPCSPPMTVVIAQVSYTNVTLTGLAGDTSTEPQRLPVPRDRHLLAAWPFDAEGRQLAAPPYTKGDGSKPYNARLQQRSSDLRDQARDLHPHQDQAQAAPYPSGHRSASAGTYYRPINPCTDR